jgi:hypothetical protein
MVQVGTNFQGFLTANTGVVEGKKDNLGGTLERPIQQEEKLMSDFLGNLGTFLGGVLGGGIGFLVIAIVIIAVLIPLIFWTHDSRAPVKHSGLERFRASLNKPDEGYDDRIPDRVPPDVSSENFTETNQPV